MNALENLTFRSSCIIGSSMLSSLAYRPGRLLGDSGQLGSCLCTFDPVAEGEFLPPRSSLSFQSQPAQEVHQNHRGFAMCFPPWRFLSAVFPLGAVFAFSQVDAKETAPTSMANVTMCLNRAFFWQRWPRTLEMCISFLFWWTEGHPGEHPGPRKLLFNTLSFQDLAESLGKLSH